MKRYFVPLPVGCFGVAAAEAMLLTLYPNAVRAGRTPGGWQFDGGRAVTTCRGVWIRTGEVSA